MTSAKPARIIVNIVGLPGSGKSTICAYLQKTQSFELYRPSDALRAYAKANNRPLNRRQDYINCHRAMVAQDPDAMIQPVLHSSADKICIDGLRAPSSTKKLQEIYGAVCIILDCPIEKRFANVQKDPHRSGHRSQATLEQFQADELPDYHNDDPNLPSMDGIVAIADYRVNSNRPLKEVCQEIDKIIAGLQSAS